MSCLWVGACVLETLRKKGLQVHPPHSLGGCQGLLARAAVCSLASDIGQLIQDHTAWQGLEPASEDCFFRFRDLPSLMTRRASWLG